MFFLPITGLLTLVSRKGPENQTRPTRKGSVVEVVVLRFVQFLISV